MNAFSPRIARASLLALSLAVMAGCQTTASSAIDTSCGAFGPITWSRSDTVETVHQVRGHNAAYRSLCGA